MEIKAGDQAGIPQRSLFKIGLHDLGLEVKDRRYNLRTRDSGAGGVESWGPARWRSGWEGQKWPRRVPLSAVADGHRKADISYTLSGLPLPSRIPRSYLTVFPYKRR